MYGFLGGGRGGGHGRGGGGYSRAAAHARGTHAYQALFATAHSVARVAIFENATWTCTYKVEPHCSSSRRRQRLLTHAGSSRPAITNYVTAEYQTTAA
jgi:hypothetical protein